METRQPAETFHVDGPRERYVIAANALIDAVELGGDELREAIDERDAALRELHMHENRLAIASGAEPPHVINLGTVTRPQGSSETRISHGGPRRICVTGGALSLNHGRPRGS